MLTLSGTAAANSTVRVYDCSTQIGTTTANSSGSRSMCGRPVRCKWLSLAMSTRSDASMCTACSRSATWLLALMNSADRFPNHIIALEALYSPGFRQSPV
jgi:hypothetical protein